MNSNLKHGCFLHYLWLLEKDILCVKKDFQEEGKKRVLSCSTDFLFSSYITFISFRFTEDVISCI
jgi:hypothetical protein